MTTIKEQLQKIPFSPGVYFFRNAKGQIIYIGKAVNLKARVKSYFSQKLYGLKAAMLPGIAKIDYKITDTEIDALILESQYIKKHRPKYNIMLKDDKNYFYVVVSADKFPKIFITHQPAKYRASCGYAFEEHPQANLLGVFQYNCAERTEKQIRRGRASGAAGSGASVSSKAYPKDAVVLGPYTDGTALKTTLRFLRKIFPYCTCKTQHKLPCLKAHLRLCLGICCTYSTDNLQPTTYNRLIKTYNKNIKSIIDILSGKKKSILAKLEKEMNAAAKKEKFEKATEIRGKITALKNIFEHKIKTNTQTQDFEKATKELSNILGFKISRIEFYDISNIQGQLATGSMVVFDGEKINKSEYRKFKIKTVFQPDDPAMMKEVLMRRLKHTEWPMPDLIIVDGGITHLNAAKDVLARFCHSRRLFCHSRPVSQYGVNSGGNPDSMNAGLDPRSPIAVEDRFHGNDRKKVKIASLAKNPDRLFLSPLKAISLKDLPQNLNLLLQNLRDEAHRFAIGYHKKLRSKKLKNEFGY